MLAWTEPVALAVAAARHDPDGLPSLGRSVPPAT